MIFINLEVALIISDSFPYFLDLHKGVIFNKFVEDDTSTCETIKLPPSAARFSFPTNVKQKHCQVTIAKR